jgi:TfoX/Sxy family transcriptional regulator of competence genes
MATNKDYADFVLSQFDESCGVTAKKMFAVVCDDQLFIRPTDAARSFIGDVVEAPPYPGAKMYFLIEDRIEDREWLSELANVTVPEVPRPKPRKKKAKKK